MIINLAKGRGSWRQPLKLPATAAEFRDAISNLQSTGESGALRIADAISPVSNLGKYISNEDVTDPDTREKLNDLATKVDAMNEKEAKTFVGALDMTSINSLDDVLRVAGKLDEYIFIHQVTTEKELGQFLVDSGYKDFPESVLPYLDYTAIGIEYNAEHDGAFTADGYTLRRSSAEPEAAEQHQGAMFTVHFTTDRMRNLGQEPYKMTLPATGAQIRYAKDSMGIEEFNEASIVKIEGLNKLPLKHIPRDSLDIEQLNELSAQLTEDLEKPSAFAALAALELEKPSTVEDALSILNRLDDYEIIQSTPEEYGRKVLLDLTDDQEVVDTIDGFINWDEFGKFMMQEDGIVRTEFGAIRRARGQEQVEFCNPQM